MLAPAADLREVFRVTAVLAAILIVSRTHGSYS